MLKYLVCRLWHKLAPTDPNRIFVATPHRTRRKLPSNLVVKHIGGIEPGAVYDGIPCQSVYDAIASCEGKMLPERLVAAANEARRQGLISKTECDSLLERLAGNDSQATE